MTFDFGLLTSIGELEYVAGALIEDDKPYGFDIETGYRGKDRNRGALYPEFALTAGISLGTSQWARYIPIAHDDAANLDAGEVARVLKPLADTSLGVAHNAMFEVRHLAHSIEDGGLGFDWGIYSDTMIEAYVLQRYKGIGLKSLTKDVFDYEQAEISSLWPNAKKKELKMLRFNTLPLSNEVVYYACDDALQSARLHELHYPEVKDNFIFQLEMGLQDCLIEMERTGLWYDWAAMRTKKVELEEFLAKLHSQIQGELSRLVGEPVDVNLASPKQVGEILYGRLNMPVTVKTNTGNASVGAEALEGLRQQYPVVKWILWYKECKKLLGSYLVKYERDYGFAEDGRTHPSINQTGVVSGRFSVNDPPYHSSPKKYKYELEDGATFNCHFRRFIRPEAGRYFLYYDYSQVELRVLAGVSQEPGLLTPFANGIDIHKATASQMMKTALEDVTDEQRSKGKSQPVSEPVLTPQGWTTMGEVKVGDSLIGADGKPARVNAVHKQGMRPVWAVTFSDNSVVRCDPDHLWTVSNTKKKGLDGLHKLRDIKAAWTKHDNRPVIPSVVIKYRRKDLPVDPYLLGALLGDGCFRMGVPNLTSADPEMFGICENLLPEGVVAKTRHPKDRTPFQTYTSGPGANKNPLVEALRDLALMGPSSTGAAGWGVSSHEKFIPELYMRSSVSQRLSMLQGLLDTDGSVAGNMVEHSTVSEQLSKDVAELVRSLGGRCHVVQRVTTCQSGSFPSYRLKIAGIKNLFRLERKASVAGFTPAVEAMKSIDDLGYEEESVCFEVDTHHYVTSNNKLTHNTLNFGLLYGMSEKALGQRLSITLAEAEQLFADYFSAFSSIDAWVNRQKAEGSRLGYTMSHFGRKHRIWELDSPNKHIRSTGLRLCVNAPIQGGAADYMKMAMLRQHKLLTARGMKDKVRLVMNNHDSLTWEVDNDVPPGDLINILDPIVSFPIEGFPPILADWAIGLDNWSDLTEVDKQTMSLTALAEEWREGEPASERVAPEDSTLHVQAVPEVAAPNVELEEPETVERAESGLSGEIEAEGPNLFTVTIKDMPTAEQYQAWLALLERKPGSTRLVLATPEGELAYGFGTSLTLADEIQVQAALPNALCTYSVEDLSGLDMEGIEL